MYGCGIADGWVSSAPEHEHVPLHMAADHNAAVRWQRATKWIARVAIGVVSLGVVARMQGHRRGGLVWVWRLRQQQSIVDEFLLVVVVFSIPLLISASSPHQAIAQCVGHPTRGGGSKGGWVDQRPGSVVFERHPPPPPGGWGWDFLGCWVCKLWNSGALKMCI